MRVTINDRAGTILDWQPAAGCTLTVSTDFKWVDVADEANPGMLTLQTRLSANGVGSWTLSNLRGEVIATGQSPGVADLALEAGDYEIVFTVGDGHDRLGRADETNPGDR